MFQGVGNFGLWMFSRGCGTRHRGCGTRSRALTREFLIREGVAHVTAFPGRAHARKAPTPVGVEPLSPDAGRGRDAPRVRGTRLRVDAERKGIQGVRGESFCEKWGGGFGGRALFQ